MIFFLSFLILSPERTSFLNAYIIQSIEHIRVCTSMKDKPLTEYRFKDVQTLYDVLKKGKELSSKIQCRFAFWEFLFRFEAERAHATLFNIKHCKFTLPTKIKRRWSMSRETRWSRSRPVPMDNLFRGDQEGSSHRLGTSQYGHFEEQRYQHWHLLF